MLFMLFIYREGNNNYVLGKRFSMKHKAAACFSFPAFLIVQTKQNRFKSIKQNVCIKVACLFCIN